jgi:hypothetical protein
VACVSESLKGKPIVQLIASRDRMMPVRYAGAVVAAIIEQVVGGCNRAARCERRAWHAAAPELPRAAR